MRTRRNFKDDLLNKARKLTGIQEKSSLVRLGLEALISRESAKRLAKLGRKRKEIEEDPPRRGSIAYH